MRNIFYVMAMLCLFVTTVNAQQVGKPAGNNPVNNFFDTSTSGGQLGHSQSGTFGNVLGGGKWIGIGQPSTGPAAYGMRIQDGNRFCTLDIQSGDSEIFWGGSASNDFNFGYASNATTPATNIMTLKASGRVGIGTTSPASSLHVLGNTTQLAQFIQTTSNSKSGYITIRGSKNSTAGNIAFINLNNYDDNEAGGTAYTMGRVSAGMETASGQTGYLHFYTNVGASLKERMRIKSNGNVGIGTTAPTQKLQVNGNILVNGSYLSSDRRYKDEIETLEKPMELLNTINGVSYEYNRDKFPEQDFKEGKSLGFVAQDFEKALPELLIQDEKGYYAVNYDGVIPILVEAVKELNVSLEDRNLKVAADETKIENLEKEVSELKTLVKELIASQDQKQTAKVLNNSLPTLNKVELFQNTPNPSNGNTEISYLVEGKVRNITIDVYNSEGRMIQRLDNLPTGKNSVSLTEKLQAGIYFYTLFTDGQEVATKRMVVIK